MELYKELQTLLDKNNKYDAEDQDRKQADDAYRTQKLSYNNDGAGIGYYNAITEVDNELKHRRLRHNISKSKEQSREKRFLEECEKSIAKLIQDNETYIQTQNAKKTKTISQILYTMLSRQPSSFDIEKSKINSLINENYELNILLRNTRDQLSYYNQFCLQ